MPAVDTMYVASAKSGEKPHWLLCKAEQGATVLFPASLLLLNEEPSNMLTRRFNLVGAEGYATASMSLALLSSSPATECGLPG